jgi:hypothetical protein
MLVVTGQGLLRAVPVMRSHGTRFECLRVRPGDHICWVFAGLNGFADLARPFLAEGLARGEKLMYVAADTSPARVAGLAGLAGPPVLEVASIAEVYGASGMVDAARQRATFAAALADALAEGFTGIRVAADNTPLVTDEVRLKAWIEWEITADRFMSENLVTGLCAFDRDQVNVDRLRHLATLHPLSPAGRPVPQFRLFADTGELCIEGEIDSLTVDQLRLALAVSPPRTGVLIDLAAATIRGRKALASLGYLAGDGVTVTIYGEPAAIAQLRTASPATGGQLHLRETPPAIPAGPSV